jgi:hypothetical protein
MQKARLIDLLTAYDNNKGVLRKRNGDADIIVMLKKFLEQPEYAALPNDTDIEYQELVNFLGRNFQRYLVASSELLKASASVNIIREWKQVNPPDAELLLSLVEDRLLDCEVKEETHQKSLLLVHCRNFITHHQQQYPNKLWVNYREFVNFLQQAGVNDLLSSAYLYSHQLGADFFRFWSDQTHRKPQSTPVLTGDTLHSIFRYLAIDDLGRLAKTSRQFYTLAHHPMLWAPKLHKLGLTASTVTHAMMQRRNLKNLYRACRHLPRRLLINIGSEQVGLLSNLFSVRPDIVPMTVAFGPITLTVSQLLRMTNEIDLLEKKYPNSSFHHYPSNKHDYNIFEQAIFKSSPKMTTMRLFDKATDMTNRFPQAALSGNPKVITAIFEHGSLDLMDKNSRVIAHYAAQSGNPDMLACLQTYRINLKSRDKGGRSLVHFGALSGNPLMLEWLKAEGFDLHAIDNQGLSILHYGVLSGNTDMLDCFQAWGFHTIEPKNYPHLLDFGISSGNSDMVFTLLQLGFHDHHFQYNTENKTVKMPQGHIYLMAEMGLEMSDSCLAVIIKKTLEFNQQPNYNDPLTPQQTTQVSRAQHWARFFVRSFVGRDTMTVGTIAGSCFSEVIFVGMAAGIITTPFAAAAVTTIASASIISLSIHGISRAATRKPITPEEQTQLNQSFSQLTKSLSEDEKAQCIQRIVLAYLGERSTVNSASSKEAIHFFQSPIPTTQKWEVLGEYISTVDADGFNKNNGKKLFLLSKAEIENSESHLTQNQVMLVGNRK